MNEQFHIKNLTEEVLNDYLFTLFKTYEHWAKSIFGHEFWIVNNGDRFQKIPYYCEYIVYHETMVLLFDKFRLLREERINLNKQFKYYTGYPISQLFAYLRTYYFESENNMGNKEKFESLITNDLIEYFNSQSRYME